MLLSETFDLFSRLNKKSRIMHWFLNVEYEDGGKSDTYTGLRLRKGDEIKMFDSGDPIVDYMDFRQQMFDQHILCSSSWDHFFMDQKKYVERYLKEVEGGFEFMSPEEVRNISWSRMDETPTIIATSRMKSLKAVKRHYQKFKNIFKQKSL